MLVIDDEQRNRKLLEGFLRSEGYFVRCSPDGASVLPWIREKLPEVILLDVMMPNMNGLEVCRIVKSDPRTRICQVMMVTALAGTTNKVLGLDTGADDYVTKPVRREEFLAKVRALVRVSRLLQELEVARDSLAARNEELQFKKTLAQTLVHDLKSPLSAILATLDLLPTAQGERGERLIEQSRHSASRMLKMIVNLLDVERLEEGRLTPELQRVDVAEVARAAVDEARVTAEQRGVSLDLDVPRVAWAEVDAGLLRRVMDNLISNAVAHSPAESRARVAVHHRPEGVEVAVADSGPGVPEELREAVFEKYAQVGPKASRRSMNRGLGLTFCRLAVEAHGGTIWVDDAPAGGACFRTLVPEASSAEEPLPETAMAEASDASAGR